MSADLLILGIAFSALLIVAALWLYEIWSLRALQFFKSADRNDPAARKKFFDAFWMLPHRMRSFPSLAARGVRLDQYFGDPAMRSALIFHLGKAREDYGSPRLDAVDSAAFAIVLAGAHEGSVVATDILIEGLTPEWIASNLGDVEFMLVATRQPERIFELFPISLRRWERHGEQVYNALVAWKPELEEAFRDELYSCAIAGEMPEAIRVALSLIKNEESDDNDEEPAGDNSSEATELESADTEKNPGKPEEHPAGELFDALFRQLADASSDPLLQNPNGLLHALFPHKGDSCCDALFQELNVPAGRIALLRHFNVEYTRHEANVTHLIEVLAEFGEYFHEEVEECIFQHPEGARYVLRRFMQNPSQWNGQVAAMLITALFPNMREPLIDQDGEAVTAVFEREVKEAEKLLRSVALTPEIVRTLEDLQAEALQVCN